VVSRFYINCKALLHFIKNFKFSAFLFEQFCVTFFVDLLNNDSFGMKFQLGRRPAAVILKYTIEPKLIEKMASKTSHQAGKISKI
jgi:hypothetical protein